jgi:hypothetical protein
MKLRREFLKLFGISGVAGIALGELLATTSSAKQVLGYVNWREMDSFPAGLVERCMGGKVFVDGVEIKLAWYVNTETGIVKTYDVFHDGNPRPVIKSPGWLGAAIRDYYTEKHFPGREVDCPVDGALSETLRGKVELFTA